MNIQEAVKKALAENKCITIPTEEGKIYFKIKPTNEVEENCILIDHKNIPMNKNICALSHGWQPNANDLISDDWIVTDNERLK